MIVYNNIESGMTEVYWGNTNIAQVYIGSNKVFPSDVPPTNTKFSATYIGGQTYTKDCDGYTELSLSETKPSGYEYTAMTTADIGDCVTSIGSSAFYQCSGLTSITIPESVTSIGVWVFNGCTSLPSVTIPSGVTSIGDMTFYGCSSLTSVNIPSGVTSIGVYAFFQCSGLTAITCEATTPPTLGSSVFDGTNNCPIYVPCESLESYKTAWTNYASRIQCVEPFGGKFKATYSGGETYEKECDAGQILTSGETRGGLHDYTIMTSAEIGDCVTRISEKAFSSFYNLASVTIGNNLAYIEDNAFISCDRLSSINFPDSLISIGYGAFYSCRSLTSITIPNSVTRIGEAAFDGCSSLTSVTIGNGVRIIGEDAFAHCRSLTSITVNATTPPILGSNVFYGTNDCPIYVPAASVEAYKTASSWSNYASRIQAIP